MDEVYKLYRQGGLITREIHYNKESWKAMDSFATRQSPTIRINYAHAQERVLRADQNDHTIEERMRLIYYQLLFQHLPHILVNYMVIESARKLNYFPSKHGVSKYYSPRMILHHENLDLNKHCKHVLGEYVQAHEERHPKNNNSPRSLDYTYLQHTSNHQGGHELLHIQTNRVIIQNTVTTVAIMLSVIEQAHEIARINKMQHGLKTTNRENVTLYNASWSAGVDYE